MIRLLAYNVSGALDSAAVTTVLKALRPDVACLVETPGRLALRRIAAGADLRTATRAGRRRLGAAVLVGERVRVLSTGEVELGPAEGAPGRTAAQAIVGIGALRFAVVAVQLGLRPDARLAHGVELERFAASVDVPSVLAGDFSEGPGGAATTRLARNLRDAFAVAGQGRGETYPTPDPTTRHDHVFVSRELAVERCWVPSEAPVDVASHHRPVVVELATSDRDSDRSDTHSETPADQPPEIAEPAA